jgi:hypothetical protein
MSREEYHSVQYKKKFSSLSPSFQHSKSNSAGRALANPESMSIAISCPFVIVPESN